MKQLELIDCLVVNNGESIGTADLIRMTLNNVPQGGLAPVDMRKRIRILDTLEEANGSLELEDADAKVLSDCVGQMRWNILDRGILNFCDAVELMK